MIQKQQNPCAGSNGFDDVGTVALLREQPKPRQFDGFTAVGVS
jgi:hypothetical protein